MKKTLFFTICTVFLMLNAHAQDGLITGIGFDWDEISKKEQAEIENVSKNYLTMLNSRDFDGFWEACHPKLQIATPKNAFSQYGEMVAPVIPGVDSMIFVTGKITKYETEPQQMNFSFGGTMDSEDPDFIQYYTVAGIKEQVLVIYKTDTHPVKRIVAMKFGKENNTYKLFRIDINTCSVDNKDSNYYEELAQKWSSKNRKLPQFISVCLAYRLSFLGQGTSGCDFIRISEKYKEMQQDSLLVQEAKTWKIQDNDIYDIINVDFTETLNDITPTIIYLSKVELEEEPITKEADKLFEWFKKQYPDLVSEFKQFVFQAYEEYPILSTKQYKYFRVIESIEEESE